MHHCKKKLGVKGQKLLHGGLAYLYFAPSAIRVGITKRRAERREFRVIWSIGCNVLLFEMGEPKWVYLYAKERLSK